MDRYVSYQGISVTIVFVVFLIVAIVAWPRYTLYKQEMDGIAALRRAEWNNRITIEESKAVIHRAKAEGAAGVEKAKILESYLYEGNDNLKKKVVLELILGSSGEGRGKTATVEDSPVE